MELCARVPKLCLIALTLVAISASAQRSSQTSEPPEIQLTHEGFLILNTPKGWERTDGPGMETFVKKGTDLETADVWIYISGCPIGPQEDLKNRDEYIQSDITGFHARFKYGTESRNLWRFPI